mmetsp:Transcript_24695/g.48436  ORF Transcript_24695/g.48436 Transcript_24695/m.48436 type:complete len:153 (+) Transcript_24695:68-526(+)
MAVNYEGDKKSNVPCYYLAVGPDELMIAGGLYFPPTALLDKVRKKIAEDPAGFKKMISSANFKKHFGSDPFKENDRLKTAPKGFEKDHPDINLLRLKSMHVSAVMDKKSSPIAKATGGDFLAFVIETFKALAPYNHWLCSALGLDPSVPAIS